MCDRLLGPKTLSTLPQRHQRDSIKKRFKDLGVDISKGISFVCAGMVGYLFNKHWTFSQHHRSHSEMVRYGATEFFLLGFNISFNKGVLMLWPEATFPAAVAASLSTALVSFVLKKTWVFKTA